MSELRRTPLAVTRRATPPRGSIAAVIGLAIVMIVGSASVTRAITPDVALTVHELLPLESTRGATVPGRARTAEPVTAGIPLSHADNVTDVSTLTMMDDRGGSVPAQFRVLRRHASGRVQWVLVDFKTDLPEGGVRTFRLIRGDNPASTLPALAHDDGETIVIDTGAARFVLRKAGFDMFHEVSVGPRLLVDAGAGHPGLVVRSGDATYSSAADPDSVAVIEENGPLRAVVKALGALRDDAGRRLMDYTVRLHFYRNDAAVKAFVTLRHAQFHNSAPAPFVHFDSAEIVVPLSVEAPTFTMSRSGGAVTGTLRRRRDSATLFQGFSRRFLSSHVWGCSGTSRIPPMERTCASTSSEVGTYAQQGLEIRRGDQVVQPLGDDSQTTEGWAQLHSSDGAGLTVALRWMAGLWPAGFEMMGDGRASVELFSKRNSKRDIPFTWGAHETREVLFDFTPAQTDGRGPLWRLQYPLVARAPIGQYAAAGAFFGETMLASGAEYEAFVAKRQDLVSVAPGRYALTDRHMSLSRFYLWESPNQQHDHELAQVVDFLRTGYSGRYLVAESWTMYKADNAVVRSDGFDLATKRPGGSTFGQVWPNRYRAPNGGMNGQEFDHSHPHWLSIPILYYLTGNEALREAAIDYGEMRAADVRPNLGINSDDPLNQRAWFRVWRDFALMHEFDPREIYLGVVREMTRLYLDERDRPGDVTKGGRNLERGYVVKGGTGRKRPHVRNISQNIYSRIAPEAMWQVLRVLRAVREPRVEDLADAMEGHGLFVYHEPYFQVVPRPRPYEFGYWAGSKVKGNNYHLDAANLLEYRPAFTPQDSCQIMRYLYERTGDPRYLERGAMLLIGASAGESDQPGAPQCAAFVALDMRPDLQARAGRPDVSDVMVTALGGGAYRLSWVAPPDAARYQVKYADKPIVDWLGFDQLTRRFQFSPDDFVAFFAAHNIDGEPAPEPAGVLQEIVISGLDPTKTWHFAIRFTRRP